MQPQGKETQQVEEPPHGFDPENGCLGGAVGPTVGTPLNQPWEASCLKHLSYP